MRFEGKTVAITGGGGGIGSALVRRFAREGASVRCIDIDAGRARAAADAAGSAAEAVVADVTLAAEVERALAGRVDVLVNNSLSATGDNLVTIDEQAWRRDIDGTLTSAYLCTRAVLPGMVERGEGAVINVASLLAFSGSWEAPHLPQRAVYAASKSFLVTFTQVIAGELRDSGVRVQVVCPGIVRSEFHSRQGLDLSAVPRMEPRSVVQASLLDLDRGVVVSIPGSDDETALGRVEAAQRELITTTRTVELPDRYRAEPHA